MRPDARDRNTESERAPDDLFRVVFPGTSFNLSPRSGESGEEHIATDFFIPVLNFSFRL